MNFLIKLLLLIVLLPMAAVALVWMLLGVAVIGSLL